MQIAICDDNRKWCQRAERIIEEYAEWILLDMEIVCFESGEELLAYEGKPIDILFLDIRMKEMNGIETASLINEKWETCQIIYLTNYLYYATEVYKTKHVFFVLKEQLEEKLGEVMDKAMHEIEQKRKKLVFTVISQGNVVLAPKDILYFERSVRVTKIETVWGTYKIWDKIDDIEKILPEIDFVRCHSSCIVYLPAIREMLKDAFIMADGRKVAISRSHSRASKAAFMKWALTQMS